MLSQVVVNRPYANLGGNEGIGSRGGYFNYTEHFPQLWKCDSVQRWLRKKQDSTRAEYLARFEKFLLWASDRINVRNPDQFLTWANSQPSGLDVQDLIDQYAETQLKSNAHIATALLRSFLGKNACEKPLPKIDWDSTVSFAEGFKRGEIQKLLGQLPNPVHKAYVTLAKDSGLRANDLLYIRYKHIAKDYATGQKFVHVEFEKERYQRKKAPGRTFFGPNTLDLLRQLFENGTLSRNPDAKLFNFSYRNIAKVLDHAKKTGGIDPKIQPNHGLRKYFENQLDRAGLDVDKKRQLEGHSAGVRNAYTSRDIDGLRELYASAYQYLDLSEQAATSGEVRELQARDLEKTRHIESLKEELADREATLRTVLARLEKIEKRLPPDEQSKD